MRYTNNQNINDLIKSCGGILDFRDIIIMENSKSKELRATKVRMAQRHWERKTRNYKRIK